MLLIAALFALDADHYGRHRRLTRLFDFFLFGLQTLAFVALFVSGAHGFGPSSASGRGHFYLLALATVPAPLLLVLCQRVLLPRSVREEGRPATARAFAAYTAGMVLLLAYAALWRRADVALLLFAGAIAVRSFSYARYIY